MAEPFSFSALYGNAAIKRLEALIDLALQEDDVLQDATSQATIPADSNASFAFVTRQEMSVSALFLIPKVYAALARKMSCLPPQVVAHVQEGESVGRGKTLLTAKGNAHLLLAGERVALNFLQRCCGVASLTRRYVAQLEGLNCQLLDTRKTLPGFRELDKYAVLCGGGTNHRLNLGDAVLIKDNHLSMQPDIAAAISAARRHAPAKLIVIECDTIEQTAQALIAQPDRILLDNMTLSDLTQVVSMRHEAAPQIMLEASGGVTLETLRNIAKTGVDAISVGALTHSAAAVDIGLDREIMQR